MLTLMGKRLVLHCIFKNIMVRYKSMNSEEKGKYRIIIFIMLFLLSILVSFQIGRYPVSPMELIKIICSRILPIEQSWSRQAELVVFNIRLPRIFLSSLIGASLALSGLLLQQVFRNPMASQDVLGSSSASAFGASLALLCGSNYIMVSLSSFLFGLLSLVIIILISSRLKRRDNVTLILCGIMISSLFSSATSFIKLVADTEESLPAITYFLMGSLSSFRSSDLILVFSVTLIAAIPVLLLSWRINLLSLGEEEAASLGVNTMRLRFLAITSSTLLTASSVAAAGQIGWVGLVIPHFTRIICGSNTKITIPAAMLLGASFLTVVDTLSRSLTTSEIPIGILTSFVGAPFFLLLIKKEADRHDA